MAHSERLFWTEHFTATFYLSNVFPFRYLVVYSFIVTRLVLTVVSLLRELYYMISDFAKTVTVNYL